MFPVREKSTASVPLIFSENANLSDHTMVKLLKRVNNGSTSYWNRAILYDSYKKNSGSSTGFKIVVFSGNFTVLVRFVVTSEMDGLVLVGRSNEESSDMTRLQVMPLFPPTTRGAYYYLLLLLLLLILILMYPYH